MNLADLYSVCYVLVADEVGGRAVLEKQLDDFEAELEKKRYDMSQDRFAPDKKLPEKAAEGLKGIMAFGAPAPRREDA